jgi:cell division protein FtsB
MEKKDIIKIGLALTILLILLVPRFYKLQKNKNELKAQIQFQKQRIEQLRQENVALEREIYLLKEDPDYREEVARNEMGLIKKGEIIYRTAPEN